MSSFRLPSSLKGRFNLMFMILGAVLIMILVCYWTAVLEPRLREEAKANAGVLVHSQAQLLSESLSHTGASFDPVWFNRMIDQILILTDPNTGHPFILGLEVEIDFDTVKIQPGELELVRGDVACTSCFVTEVPLYSSVTRELIGLARFYSSEHFFQHIKEDVRRNLLLFAGLVTIMLAIAWWGTAILLKPMATMAMALHNSESSGSPPSLDLGRAVSMEISTVKDAVEDLFRNIFKSNLALSESDQRLRLLLDSTGEGIYGLDLDGKCIFANQACADLIGYGSAEELFGRNMHQLLHHSKVDGSPCCQEDCRIVDVARTGRNIHVEDDVFWRKDGTWFSVSYWVYPVLEENSIIGTVVSFNDITEQLAAQKEVQRAHELRKRVIDESPIGIAFYDDAGQCIAANESVAEIVGATRSQLLAQNYHHIESWKKSGMYNMANEAIAQQRKMSMEVQLTTTFGKVAILDCQIVPFKSMEDNLHLLLMLTDISERKRIEMELLQHREHLEMLVSERTRELKEAQEELLRKNRLATLGQLTATVSHELRNPLGAMRPSLYIINKRIDQKDDKVCQAMKRVERNIVRCDHIVDELLDFTRIQNLNLLPIPIDAWLGSILDELPVPAGITLVRELNLPALSAMLDQDRLRRAVINVYDNANQAMLEEEMTEQGKKSTLTVSTRQGEDRVEILFTDNGPGMVPDVQKKIFEPLYSTKNFGVGLGLPTVKQIMEQHGGGIEVETETGLGTTMVLWLPKRQRESAAS